MVQPENILNVPGMDWCPAVWSTWPHLFIFVSLADDTVENLQLRDGHLTTLLHQSLLDDINSLDFNSVTKAISMISSWQTGSGIKEANVKIVHSVFSIQTTALFQFKLRLKCCLCCPLADCIFALIFAGLSVNSLMLRLKAKELSSDPEFKASLGWYTNWKRRHAISMRTKTTLAQRLPADMEDKVIEFHQFVLRTRQCCGYESSHILNMDETPMRFELPVTRTLELTRNRTVPILSHSGDKQSFTVVLAVKVSGEKLLLKVIFKGVRQLRIQVPLRMQVSIHKKGWMDEGLFLFFFNIYGVFYIPIAAMTNASSDLW